jgi:hypothetical protein
VNSGWLANNNSKPDLEVPAGLFMPDKLHSVMVDELAVLEEVPLFNADDQHHTTSPLEQCFSFGKVANI